MVRANVSAERFSGLDIWRAILPMIGIWYHTSEQFRWRDGQDWMVVLGIATHSFRMEAFFALAGLLSGGRLIRPGYLLTRYRVLLVPVATFWLATIALHPERMYGFLGGGNHHLWFLMSLALLMTIAVIIERGGWLRPLLARWQVTLCCCLAWAVAARLFGMTRSEYPLSLFSVMKLSVYYAPFVLTGIVASRVPSAAAVFVDARHMWRIGCVGSIVLIGLWLFDPAMWRPDAEERVGYSLLIVATAACWVTGLLGMGMDRNAPPASVRVRWLAEAGFTVYLLHYPVIKLIYRIFGATNGGVRFALCIVMATVVPLAIHALTKRVPLLRFLLNGVAPSSGNWIWQPVKQPASGDTAHASLITR